MILAQFRETPYCARILEQLDLALGGADEEYAALVSDSGLLLHGVVAGAPGVVRVHALVGVEASALRVLVDALRAGSTGRVLVCEMAQDAPFAVALDTLIECGFAREGHVPDFFRDGVGLDILTWRFLDNMEGQPGQGAEAMSEGNNGLGA